VTNVEIKHVDLNENMIREVTFIRNNFDPRWETAGR
jgi:hypothetical protein